MKTRFPLLVPPALCVAGARADIMSYLKEVPNCLGPNSLTYDLMVHVSGYDEWTSTSTKAMLHGATFTTIRSAVTRSRIRTSSASSPNCRGIRS